MSLRSILVLALLLVGQQCSAEDRILAASDFQIGMEDWTTYTEGSSDAPAASVRFYPEREHDFRPIESDDAGPTLWYFSAPPAFLGNKVEALGGYLEFILSWSSLSLGLMERGHYDVKLVGGEGGIEQIGRKDVVPYEISYRGQHRVHLVDDGSWEIVQTGTRASEADIRRILSSLTAVLIRGGYYNGPEITHLSGVALTASSARGHSRLSVEQVSTYTIPVLDTNIKDGDELVEESAMLKNVVWNIPFPKAGSMFGKFDTQPMGEFNIVGIGSHGDSFCTISVSIMQLMLGEHFAEFDMRDRQGRETGIVSKIVFERIDPNETSAASEFDYHSEL